MQQENKFGYTMEKGTLSLNKGNDVDVNSLYLIDFSKMNSVNDLLLVLSAMGFSFPGSHPYIEQIKPFLNLDNPIPIQPNNQPPKQVDLKLPKLKGL